MLEIRHIKKSFGGNKVLDDVSLKVSEGEMFFLLGPSGCGKTTLLRAIAGFVEPDSGEISIGGQAMKRVPVQERGIGMVFQSYALWPHMTVRRNLSLGLELRGLSAQQIRSQTDDAMRSLRISELADRLPGNISGGQAQRVALARALVLRPKLVLLDEPLSNLDPALRHELRAEILRLQRSSGLTMIFVTHDQEEALSMADRIALLQGGRIAQLGAPRELYDHPGSSFAASFLGATNLIDATGCADGSFDTALGRFAASRPAKGGEHCRLSIRPEHVRPGSEGGSSNSLRMAVESVSFLGPIKLAELRADGGARLECLLAAGDPAFEKLEARSSVNVRIDPRHILPLES